MFQLIKEKKFVVFITLVFITLVFILGSSLWAQDMMLLDFAGIWGDAEANGISYDEGTHLDGTEPPQSLVIDDWMVLSGRNWDAVELIDEYDVQPYRVGMEARVHSGQTVMNIKGTLDWDQPSIVLVPPFPIPLDDQFLGYGLLKDLPSIHYVAMNAANHGEDLIVNLLVFSETGFGSILIDLGTTNWRQKFPEDEYGYPDEGPVWFQIAEEIPFSSLNSSLDEVQYPDIRIRGIEISSREIQEYKNNQSLIRAVMTPSEYVELDREVEEGNWTPPDISTELDLYLHSIILSTGDGW